MVSAITTYYNGHKFRSRLEARWAVFFDSLKMPYIYEPEGLNIDGTFYLPDFYLPDCKQFFECKGVMSDLDEKKVQALMKAGHPVTIGYDEGKFVACDYWHDGLSLATEGTSMLCQCIKCGKYWFMGSSGDYTCPCCGAYDGDGHFRVRMECFDRYCRYDWLWDVARQAQFDKRVVIRAHE